jgi:hypothetical protein
MGTLDSVFRAIERAVAEPSNAAFVEVAHELESQLMDEGAEGVKRASELIVRLLQSDSFRNATGSWRVLFAFRDDIERLPEDQKRALFGAMTDAYSSFTDWMSCFTVSELCEYFANDWALDAVKSKLMATADEKRCYVPHALEHIARGASDETTREGAFDSLVSMLDDPQEAVRAEVMLSLGRIARSESVLASLARDIVNNLATL